MQPVSFVIQDSDIQSICHDFLDGTSFERARIVAEEGLCKIHGKSLANLLIYHHNHLLCKKEVYQFKQRTYSP
jgi:hypothetical protein